MEKNQGRSRGQYYSFKFKSYETEGCEAVDKKGKPIRRFIGNVFKATLSKRERETVNKEKVKKLLSEDDYAKVSKVSSYPVLRID